MIMSEQELTQDQMRLLILISKFSKPAKTRNEEETWLKKIPLMALIDRGLRQDIFTGYDTAPTLVEYMGTTRYASISKEGEDDIADLRELGFVERLKLATSHHVYVSAYRITPGGVTRVVSLEKKHHEAIDKLIGCKKCNSEVEIEAKDDAPYLICKKCMIKEKIDIFDIQEVAYVSSPLFSDIWLPPDR
jgi:hypothetical protein